MRWLNANRRRTYALTAAATAFNLLSAPFCRVRLSAGGIGPTLVVLTYMLGGRRLAHEQRKDQL